MEPHLPCHADLNNSNVLNEPEAQLFYHRTCTVALFTVFGKGKISNNLTLQEYIANIFYMEYHRFSQVTKQKTLLFSWICQKHFYYKTEVLYLSWKLKVVLCYKYTPIREYFKFHFTLSCCAYLPYYLEAVIRNSSTTLITQSSYQLLFSAQNSEWPGTECNINATYRILFSPYVCSCCAALLS